MIQSTEKKNWRRAHTDQQQVKDEPTAKLELTDDEVRLRLSLFVSLCNKRHELLGQYVQLTGYQDLFRLSNDGIT